MNKAIGRDWADIERELFTLEEIAAAEFKASIVCEQIKAGKAKNLSQRDSEDLSGVSGSLAPANSTKFGDTLNHSRDHH